MDLSPPPVSCSFCGKFQDAVKKIVAGPAARICDECIGLCADIVSEDDRCIIIKHFPGKDGGFELRINDGGGYLFSDEQIDKVPKDDLIGSSIWRCRLERHC